MSDASAILQNLRREQRRARVVVGLAVAAAAAWSAWGFVQSRRALEVKPSDRASVAQGPEGPTKESVASGDGAPRSSIGSTAAALNESVFQARLWVEPPRPIEPLASESPPPPPPQPPPPFKLLLVGIERGESAAVAAIVYDPESFKATRVVQGGTVDRYVLEELGERQVVFVDTQHPSKFRHTLRLRTSEPVRTPLKIVNNPPQSGASR